MGENTDFPWSRQGQNRTSYFKEPGTERSAVPEYCLPLTEGKFILELRVRQLWLPVLMRDGVKVARMALNHLVGVRIPVPQ